MAWLSRSTLGIVIAWAVLVLPLLVTGRGGTPAAFDQDQTHRPMIMKFAKEWPMFDLSDYPSATTPAYHIVMASFVRLGVGDLGLRLVSSLFGLMCAIALFSMTSAYGGPGFGVLSSLVFLCSPYVVSGSIWLTTDNLAMYGALATVAASLSLLGGSRFVGPICNAGINALLATAVRQVSLWSIACPLAALLLAPVSRGRERWVPMVAAAIAGIPSIAVVIYFLYLWGGLVPPSVQEVHIKGGANWATPAYGLALIGLWGCLFVPCIVNSLSWVKVPSVWLGAVLGFLVGAAVPTSFSFADGRWGGVLWNVVGRLPVVLDRSPVVVAFACLGGGLVAGLIKEARDRPSGAVTLFALSSLCLCVVANTANHQSYERYLQPFVLAMLGVAVSPLCCFGAQDGGAVESISWLRLGGLYIAALGGVVLTFVNVYVRSYQ